MTIPDPDLVTSPDCRTGKHTACVGDAWDEFADEPTACECDCHRPDADDQEGTT